jgi:molybdopterin synthase catalytic subunit
MFPRRLGGPIAVSAIAHSTATGGRLGSLGYCRGMSGSGTAATGSAPRTYAAVVDTPLSVDALLARVTGRRVGGIGLFLGVIRELDEGAEVSSLDYTAHPSAADALRRCVEVVAADFDVLSVAVEHRIGRLVVGELAVVVAVGAAHRAPALEACRRLIDNLKSEVPIWKEQHFADGHVGWVGLDVPG